MQGEDDYFLAVQVRALNLSGITLDPITGVSH